MGSTHASELPLCRGRRSGRYAGGEIIVPVGERRARRRQRNRSRSAAPRVRRWMFSTLRKFRRARVRSEKRVSNQVALGVRGARQGKSTPHPCRAPARRGGSRAHVERSAVEVRARRGGTPCRGSPRNLSVFGTTSHAAVARPVVAQPKVSKVVAAQPPVKDVFPGDHSSPAQTRRAGLLLVDVARSPCCAWFASAVKPAVALMALPAGVARLRVRHATAVLTTVRPSIGPPPDSPPESARSWPPARRAVHADASFRSANTVAITLSSAPRCRGRWQKRSPEPTIHAMEPARGRATLTRSLSVRSNATQGLAGRMHCSTAHCSHAALRKNSMPGRRRSPLRQARLARCRSSPYPPPLASAGAHPRRTATVAQ